MQATPRHASPTVHCSACGTPAPAVPPPLTWSASVERGARSWTCDRCVAENLRSIEGKLDSCWW